MHQPAASQIHKFQPDVNCARQVASGKGTWAYWLAWVQVDPMPYAHT